MPDVMLDYTPSEPQQLFHESTADEVMYGGAAGGGKSHALRWEALIRSLEIPRHKALILRKNFPDLEKSQIRASLEEFPREVCKYIGNKRRWEFANGSIIDFGHLDSDTDIYKYKSAEYEYIGFDELTDFTKDQYTYLLSRLRTTKKSIKPIMRSATNPEGRGLNWVKKRFIEPAKPYEVWKPERGGTRQFIPATIYDNDHVNREDYIEKLRSLPEDRMKALLEGDWNQFKGQVFKEFDNSIHVLTPFKVPNGWARYMALDWGFTKPFAILWGAVAGEDYKVGKRLIPKDSVVIYREYYGCEKGEVDKGIEKPAREVAWKIIEIEKEPVQIRIADPATWAHRGHDGPSISEIFHEEGVYMMRADNDRLAGKMQIHDRLRVNDNGHPSLFILDNCQHLIRTLPALPYDTRRPEDVDTDAEDHLYDALRYLLMGRPMKTRPKKKRKKKPPTNKYTGY